MSRPNNRDNNNNNSRSAFSSSGLATNLPPASDVGRRGGDSEGGWGRSNEPSESSGAGKYRPPTSSTSSTSTWGTATTTYARRQRQDEPVEDVDDKWSRVFKSSKPAAAAPAAPAADLPVNSRVGALGRGFGAGDEAPRPQRTFADRAARDAGDRPAFEDRAPLKENGRSFGERAAPREFGDRPPRENNRDYGDRPPRENNRDYGDRPPRENNRGDFGDRQPREGRDYGDRPPRENNRGDFGDRQPREGGRGGGGYERRDRDYEGGGRRTFGEGDARRQFNGEGRGGGRRGGPGDREWESDPRFAGKFGRDLNPRFNNADRGSVDGPLPTAPKASLDAGKAAAPPAPIPIFKEKVVAQKPAKTEKKDDANADNKAEKRKAEEEARRAKLEAEERAKQAQIDALSSSFAAVSDGIKAGLKGSALTASAKNAVGGALSPAGALKAVLTSLTDYAVKWYANDQFGDVIKSSLKGDNLNEQVSLLYVVQEYCATKKFMKVEIRGTQKKLIEVLFTNLLAAEYVDVEGIIAWADDDKDNDFEGRTDAIVQTTGMIATLRASLEEEESEVDSDEDFDAPQAHIK